MRRRVLLLMAGCVAFGTSVQATDVPIYRISASLSASAPQIRGTVDTTFVNRSTQPVREVVLLLFPNRFAAPDRDMNDSIRPFVYPREEFEPGRMDIAEIRVGETVVAAHAAADAGLPDGVALGVDLPTPLPPGAATRIRAQFATTIPQRFGTFGAFEGGITAIGGWYPYLAARRDDGSWAVNDPPALADFEVQLAVTPDLDVVLNGQLYARPYPIIRTAVRGVHYLSLVAAPTLLRDDVQVGETRFTFLHRPSLRFDRKSPGPTQLEITLAALREIVSDRPASVPPPAAELMIVEAPLRLNLTAPGEGMVVISDRTLKVLWLLRPFHQTQLAQAVYAEMLRPQLAGREPAGDYPWVSEGLSYALASSFRASTQPHARSVQEWIELFNIFSIVDRFETSPKIPFVSAFFERATTADELHEQIFTFNSDLPPGHTIFGKLRQRVGEAAFGTIVERCVYAPSEFRACAAAQSGQDLSAFFTEWLQPHPAINYEFGDVALNQRRDDQFTHQVTVRRRASREVHEPVDVRLRSVGGRTVDLRWDGSGNAGRLTAVTPGRMQQALIDPERKLIETTRTDNARPPTPQIVIDTAEVEVSSTEFGVSGLMVARGRYDYRKDLAAAGFYTNRSVGVDAGPRYHWGAQNDPTLYRNNVYAFYSVQALNGSFTDKRHPHIHTRGHLNGLGVRYDYNNVAAFENPTHEVDVRFFADWYDHGFQSSFAYVDWGASAVLTHPLWTPRTIIAGEVLNGFSEPLGSGRVPTQGLFSLGGSRSIRGIGAEDELARNIFMVRGELRQAVYPEVDLDLLDFLVLRRIQLRAFVDAGQVSNSAGAIYDPRGYAVGVGTAFAATYDFMGFFPAMAYVEMATRVDRSNKLGDVQFLFGSRQAF